MTWLVAIWVAAATWPPAPETVRVDWLRTETVCAVAPGTSVRAGRAAALRRPRPIERTRYLVRVRRYAPGQQAAWFEEREVTRELYGRLHLDDVVELAALESEAPAPAWWSE